MQLVYIIPQTPKMNGMNKNEQFWNQIGITWDKIGTVLGGLFSCQISFSGD